MTSAGGAGPVDLGSDIFDVGPPPASGYDPKFGLYCSSEGAPRNSLNHYAKDAGGSRPTDFPKSFVVLNFPVAVDCSSQPGNLKGVGMVNVIGWKS